MSRYIFPRLVETFLVFWATATLTFLAVHLLPGDPVTIQMARSGASSAVIEERRASLGWDDPLSVQYLRYLGQLVRGDLGRSWADNRPVTAVLMAAAPSTFQLALAALALAVLVGTGVGVLAALRANTWVETLSMATALLGVSLPVPWSGLLVLLIVHGWLGWGQATGRNALVLPALALGWISSGAIARLVRNGLLDILAQPYIVAARARGLTRFYILVYHVFPAAMPPILAFLALQLGFLLGGTVIVETMFLRPGLGRLAVDAVLAQDLPVVQGVVLLGAGVYLLVNRLADLIQVLIDPRLAA